MSKRMVCTLLVICLAGVVVATTAQQPPAGPPKPGPEHKRLGYFVGTWNSTADMKESPFGPAGKVNFTEKCSWLAGGFSIICHSTGSGAMGEMKGSAIMSYNAEEKRYEYYAANSFGMIEHSTGAVKGKEWDWNSASTFQGQPVKTRFMIKEESPTEYAFKMEMAVGSAPMSTAMEGKATKAVAAAAAKAKKGE